MLARLKQAKKAKPAAIILTAALLTGAAYFIYKTTFAASPLEGVTIAGQQVRIGDHMNSLPWSKLGVSVLEGGGTYFSYEPNGQMEAVIFADSNGVINGVLLYAWAKTEPYHAYSAQLGIPGAPIALPRAAQALRAASYPNLLGQEVLATNAGGKALILLKDPCLTTVTYSSLILAKDDNAVIKQISDYLGPTNPELVCG